MNNPANTVGTWQPSEVASEIYVTETARVFLTKQLEKQGGIGIRFGVKKSGCSGLTYTIAPINIIEAADYQFAITPNLKIVVDPKHFPYLQGTEIDYVKDGLSGHLQYNNPNEKNSCGCGESFGV